ncbi:unnamed protein product [Calicophoron daubneyi]|uniref:Uncharacterized protein n=1 Tax=Calicophoron daubneyi TaxID=300641 RepID=A0AAV2TGA0_CALDB
MLHHRCRNNNAAIVQELADDEGNKWYGEPDGLTLDQVNMFLDTDQPEILRLDYLENVNRSVGSSPRKVFPSPFPRKWTTSQLPSEELSAKEVPLSPGVLQSDDRTITPVGGERTVRVVWNCPPSHQSLRLAKQAIEEKLKYRRRRFLKSVRKDWEAEVKLYARLGYWAPEFMPGQPVCETENESDREMYWPRLMKHTSSSKAATSMPMNAAKWFAQKFGGMDEFYQKLDQNELEYHDLWAAKQVCDFRLPIGVSRTEFNNEVTQPHHLRSRSISTKPSEVELGKILAIHYQKTATQMTSPIDIRAMINENLLTELNRFKDFSEYQSYEAIAPVRLTRSPDVIKPLSPRTSKKSYISSTVSELGSTSPPLSSSSEKSPMPTSKKGVLHEEQPQPSADERGKTSKATLITDTTDTSVLTPMDTISFSEVESMHSMRPSEIGEENIPDQPTSALQQRSKISIGTRDKVTAQIDGTGISEFEVKGAWRSPTKSNGLIQRKRSVPEVAEGLSAGILVKNIVKRVSAKASRIGYASHMDLVDRVLQLTKKREPMVTRIIKTQFCKISDEQKNLGRVPAAETIPDRTIPLSTSETRFLLPTIAPNRPPVNLGSKPQRKTRKGLQVNKVRSSFLTADMRSLSPQIQTPARAVSVRNYAGISNSAASIRKQWPNSVVSDSENARLSARQRESRSSLGLEDSEKEELQKECHLFLLPRLPPKPENIIQAVAQELIQTSPFIANFFLRTLSQIIPEESWVTEQSPLKLTRGLERLGADLMFYRHSSGHMVRYKLMSILAAAEHNRFLRRHMRDSARQQGNWLDQLLRTLSSIRSSCRTESALALAKLASHTRLMHELISDRRESVILEIFHSLLYAADFHPSSWPEYYMAIAYLIEFSREQTIVNTLIEIGSSGSASISACCWPRLLAYIYTYWPSSVLQKLAVNEKRVANILEVAMSNPVTKKGAKAAVAALSSYHSIRSNIFAIWLPPGVNKIADAALSSTEG